MEGFYLALGVTFVLPFLQWAAPTMPRIIAYAGVTGGTLVMLAEFLDPAMKPPFGAVILFLVGILCVGGAAHLYTKAIREPKAPESKAPEKTVDLVPLPSPTLATPRPTFESTNRSVIDATGAQLPAEMPFPLARADNDSLISMPGLKMTKNSDGSTVMSFDPVNQQFPPPTGEYSKLNKRELRAQIAKASAELRVFDKEQFDAFDALLKKYPAIGSTADHPPELAGEWGALSNKNRPARERMAKLAQSLASECIVRLGSVDASTLSRAAQSGGVAVLHAKFAGPHPASDSAEFLDELSRRLN